MLSFFSKVGLLLLFLLEADLQLLFLLGAGLSGVLVVFNIELKVPIEYSDYTNVFSVKNIAELLENTGINEHAIKPKENKQPPFGFINILGLVELKTLKTYITTILTNGFIRPLKSPTGALILFDRKPNRCFRLYVNY